MKIRVYYKKGRRFFIKIVNVGSRKDLTRQKVSKIAGVSPVNFGRFEILK